MTIESILSAYGFRATEDGAMTEVAVPSFGVTGARFAPSAVTATPTAFTRGRTRPTASVSPTRRPKGSPTARLLEAVLPVACREW